jgi:hypothetical protein
MTHTAPSRSRGLGALVLAAAVGLGATGCAGDSDPVASDESTRSSPSSPESSEPSEPASGSSSDPAEVTETAGPAGQVIDITVSGDEVVPSGERVQAKVGEEITLRITADAAGEIHVHATPEQVLPYPAGTTDVPLTIDQPGVVEVESHDLHLVIVQLEVR